MVLLSLYDEVLSTSYAVLRVRALYAMILTLYMGYTQHYTRCLRHLIIYAVLETLYEVLLALYAVLETLYAVGITLYAVPSALYAVVLSLYTVL